MWRRKASRTFPRLKSDAKAEGRRKPLGEALFVRECREALRNLLGSSDLSRHRKELYRELVVGSASDPLSERQGWTAEEIRSHWNWAPRSSFLNNSEFSLTWRLVRNALPLLGLNYKAGLADMPDWPRWDSGLEKTAEHAFYYCERVRPFWDHVGEWTAARRWLRRRQRSSSISGWEACGVFCDPSCSSNGDLDYAKEGIVWRCKLFSSWSGFVF